MNAILDYDCIDEKPEELNILLGLLKLALLCIRDLKILW